MSPLIKSNDKMRHIKMRYFKPKPRLGILGGSFNPPHEGHVAVSLMAMKALNLNEIWWLPTPQNPLKKTTDLADFSKRWDMAKSLISQHKQIKLCDFEQRIGENRSALSLKRLTNLFPARTKAVFLIGSDNLLQLPQWYQFEGLMNNLPIAVFPRDPYALRAKNAKIACRYAKTCYFNKNLHHFIKIKPPALAFLFVKRNSISSTRLRGIS